MTLPNTPVPQYPNVPVAAGVPAVLRVLSQVNDVIVTATDALVTADAIASKFFNGYPAPTFGIFDSQGKAVVTGDSVVEVNFRKGWSVSTYPIEEGGFASYNKVERPFDIHLTFVFSGSIPKRSLELNTLMSVVGTLEIFQVMTPETPYASCTIVDYQYRRTNKNGANMLTVEVWLQEVRQTVINTTTQGSSDGAAPITAPAAPQATSTQNSGSVAAPASTAIQQQNLPPPAPGAAESVAPPSVPTPAVPATPTYPNIDFLSMNTHPPSGVTPVTGASTGAVDFTRGAYVG
jgi:hypothetical protein